MCVYDACHLILLISRTEEERKKKTKFNLPTAAWIPGTSLVQRRRQMLALAGALLTASSERVMYYCYRRQCRICWYKQLICLPFGEDKQPICLPVSDFSTSFSVFFLAVTISTTSNLPYQTTAPMTGAHRAHVCHELVVYDTETYCEHDSLRCRYCGSA